jgi:hypothetical protein
LDPINRTGFAIGTGRCGTLFLYQLAAMEPQVASSHERNPDNETFHRYCKWYDLPVDHEGFLAIKESEIRKDLETQAFSFEASPYLSLSVKELYERFRARFVMLIRAPDGVVSSFVHKGFYRRPYHVHDVALAAGYQDQSPERAYTSFARIAPQGEFFRTWNAMTPVGKVAWFWRAWNERTLEALKQLPEDFYRVVRIEDLDHRRYVELGRFLGFEPQVTATTFGALHESKPHAFWRKRNVDQWAAQEIREFEEQVGTLAEQFGYEYHVVRLADKARAERAEAERLGRIPKPKSGPRFWRLRRATANWMRGFATSVDVD